MGGTVCLRLRETETVPVELGKVILDVKMITVSQATMATAYRRPGRHQAEPRKSTARRR